MRIALSFAAAFAAALAVAPTAQAQSADPLNLETVAGEIGQGWVRKSATGEGVTYVCDADSCGGRGVLGVSQASASGDYVKLVVADPDKALATYKYGSEESMKATGCAFKTYDVKRQTARRVLYESVGACPDGSAATMTTIFDIDQPNVMAVQVLTKTENLALSLRDQIAGKMVAALEKSIATEQPNTPR